MIVNRLLFMIPASVVLVSFLFAIFHMIPGDPALLLAGDNAPQNVIEGIRKVMQIE